ncbi:MAG: hypothetical protein PHD97_13300, partial [Bacteroidales bacterium]|nr:hypothetical protein [Bacteroidales bacterium]
PRALSEGTQTNGTPLIKTDFFEPKDIIRIIAKTNLNHKSIMSMIIPNKISRFITHFCKKYI